VSYGKVGPAIKERRGVKRMHKNNVVDFQQHQAIKALLKIRTGAISKNEFRKRFSVYVGPFKKPQHLYVDQAMIEHRIDLLERAKNHFLEATEGELQSKRMKAMVAGYRKASVDHLENEIEFLKKLLKQGNSPLF
jgi:hypothetical protein